MLFDQLVRSRRWLYQADAGAGAGAGASGSTEDGTGEKDGKSDSKKAGEDQHDPKDEKKFSQAELDAIIDDRLKRERKKNEDAAEKQRKQAEEDALKKNQEWQQLAETRAGEIETLSKEKAELEPFKEQAEKYREALEKQLAAVKAQLPKHIVELIDRMDPVEAMDYIAKHSKELSVKPAGYSETPEARERKISKDDEQQAQRASGSLISQNF